MSLYTRTVYSLATLANAAMVNSAVEKTHGPNNMSVPFVPSGGAANATATHLASCSAFTEAGVKEFKPTLGKLVSYAVMDEAAGTLIETNVAGLQSNVGKPLSFGDFATAVGVKRRVTTTLL